MAGYSQDDTWSDYDKQAHIQLIEMQYQVESELNMSKLQNIGGDRELFIKNSYNNAVSQIKLIETILSNSNVDGREEYERLLVYFKRLREIYKPSKTEPNEN